jgi:hypothetical protein
MKFFKYLQEQMSSAPENWYKFAWIRGQHAENGLEPFSPQTGDVISWAQANMKHFDDAKHRNLLRILSTRNLPELLSFLPVDARAMQDQIDFIIAHRYSVIPKADLMNAVKAAYIESELRKKSLATYTDKDKRWGIAMELFADPGRSLKRDDYKDYPK